MKVLLNLVATITVLSTASVNAQQDVPGLTTSERAKASQIQDVLQKTVGRLEGGRAG